MSICTSQPRALIPLNQMNADGEFLDRCNTLNYGLGERDNVTEADSHVLEC